MQYNEPGDGKPEILFASIAAGGTHISTANAMKEAIESQFPEKYSIRVLDIMKEYGFTAADERHKKLWKNALANPWTIVLAQHLIDSAPMITNATIKAMMYDFAREAARRMKREPRPALVVANHGWTVVAMTLAQQRFGLNVPVVSFETSTMNANALWAEPKAERFIVASKVSMHRLVRLGVPSERIDVVGYPVRKAFLEAPPKRDAREKLGLKDEFTCLITLGGEGIGASIELVLDAISDLDKSIQTVLIAGRNRDLFREATDRVATMPNLHVRGFVDNMADYIAASDVVVGKTGPTITYEVLAVGRPMLVPRKAGLAENKMLRMLERNEVGAYTPTRDMISAKIDEYRSNADRLDRISAIAGSFDFPGLARRIALYLDSYATERKTREAVCGDGLRFLHVAG